MIFIPPLRMRRFTATMSELTIKQAMALAKIPTHLDELATTTFLRACVQNPDIDPAHWTLGERVMGAAHYLSAVSDEGADFSVGTSGAKFSDYYLPEVEVFKPESEPFECCGDTWRVRHVTGRMSESLERLQGEIDGLEGRAHWAIGLLAASLARQDDPLPDESATDDDCDAWMLARLSVFLAFPESDLMQLAGMAYIHEADIRHLFHVRSDEDGLIVMPKEVVGHPPARFPVRTAISPWTLGICGKPDRVVR